MAYALGRSREQWNVIPGEWGKQLIGLRFFPFTSLRALAQNDIIN
jgi:hypothetical protein